MATAEMAATRATAETVGPSAFAGFAEGGNLFVGNGTMAVDGATSYTGTGAVYGGVADLPGNGGDAGEPGEAGEAGAFNPEIPLGGQIDSQDLWGTNGSLGQDGQPGASGASALAGQDGDGGFPGIALDPDLHGMSPCRPTPWTTQTTADQALSARRSSLPTIWRVPATPSSSHCPRAIKRSNWHPPCRPETRR